MYMYILHVDGVLDTVLIINPQKKMAHDPTK